ncbi:MAG: UbiA family prenyltransferase, partial [Planctomycetota bacterium]
MATATAEPIPTTPSSLPASAKLLAFAADIKLSHSVFALPFALLSTVLATQQPAAVWGAWTFVLVLICMVCARTVAMAANRVLDANLDAKNPRTARRAIPAGTLSRGYVIGLIAIFTLGFTASCAGFAFFYGNWMPLALGLPVLLFLSAYPLIKRFSALCHYYLGAALALSPVCAWIAVTAGVDWPPVLMGLAVLCWTA